VDSRVGSYCLQKCVGKEISFFFLATQRRLNSDILTCFTVTHAVSISAALECCAKFHSMNVIFQLDGNYNVIKATYSNLKQTERGVN
jgi:hypothetical protein